MTDSDVLDTLITFDPGALRAMQSEIKQLKAVYAWARAQAVPFTVGDTVYITDHFQVKPGGWWHYRECLTPGAAAIVREIDFSTHHDAWFASIELHREWSVHDRGDLPGGVIRFWNGPAADTPDGYEAPSAYDQQHHPAGRKHTFMLAVRWLTPASPDGPRHSSWCIGDYGDHEASTEPCPRPM